MASLIDELEASVSTIRELDARVQAGEFFGVVLGSGLSGAADVLQDRNEIPFSEVGGFPAPKVDGHTGSITVGTVEGTTVVMLRGRIHSYEGHPVQRIVHGVRCLVHAGAQMVMLTNAAGGVPPELKVGDLMLIEDHLNLTGLNPLVGTDSLSLGPRFPDMTQAWDLGLGSALRAAAEHAGVDLKAGVYAGVLGPSYETPAEVRMIGRAGGDAVGMSTVLEAIAIRQMGGRLCGLSLISNAAAGTGSSGALLDHAEVADAGRLASDELTALLGALVRARSTWWEAP